MTESKSRPNHAVYLRVLRRMSPEARNSTVAPVKGERIQFHAMVRRPPGHAVSGAVELFDAHSGITRSLIEPWIVDDPTLEQ